LHVKKYLHQATPPPSTCGDICQCYATTTEESTRSHEVGTRFGRFIVALIPQCGISQEIEIGCNIQYLHMEKKAVEDDVEQAGNEIPQEEKVQDEEYVDEDGRKGRS